MECVVRGYLYGSSWGEYAAGGGPTTEHLPAGLAMADRLDEPIFTPATKAATGHDENLTEAGARALVGDDRYEELRARSIDIYLPCRRLCRRRGGSSADTKFEFGFADGELLLVDEVLTPDSSRYWPADAWAPGATCPPSTSSRCVTGWPPAGGTRPPGAGAARRGGRRDPERYVEAYERLTGASFADYLAGP